MAIVRAGQLRQVADPNRPDDRAFESPISAVGRVLHPLGESAPVLVVGGPTTPNGNVYWQVADDSFPGCCAPFGWVRESQTSGQPAIESFAPDCPDPSAPLSGNQLVALGIMEASTCFGDRDFTLRGDVRCARPQVDSFVAVTGPAWTADPILCQLDQAVALFGTPVTALYAGARPGQPFDGEVELTAHFNDPSADDCRWAPGNYGPISVADAPADTARFACRMSVLVTDASVIS